MAAMKIGGALVTVLCDYGGNGLHPAADSRSRERLGLLAIDKVCKCVVAVRPQQCSAWCMARVKHAVARS